MLGIGDDRPTVSRVGAVVGAAKDRVASTFDREPVQLVVAVTDRRVLTANSSAFLSRGLFEDEIDLADIRYVRSVPGEGEGKQHRIDVITRTRNYEWYFASSVDVEAAKTLGGVLAQAMSLPEEERHELTQVVPTLVEGATHQPLSS